MINFDDCSVALCLPHSMFNLCAFSFYGAILKTFECPVRS